MKALFILFLLYSSHVFSQGIPNPQIRVCLNTGSEFWDMDIEKPRKDKVAFCKFNSSSMLDAVSLIEYFHYNTSSKSLTAFLNSGDFKYSSCRSAGGIEVKSVDSYDQEYKLCVFDDYSFILKETLLRGRFHSSNNALNSALKQIVL